AERQLGDLPQHGRYQSGFARDAPRRPAARDRTIDEEEEHEADDEPRERREQTHADPDEATEARPNEGIGEGGGAEREAEREDREDRERGHESGSLDVAPNERTPALTTGDGREPPNAAPVDRHR